MSNNFNHHLAVLFTHSPALATSREGLDLIIAALSIDLSVAVIFEQDGTALCDKEHPFAQTMKRLPMLEDIFDAESLFFVGQQLPAQCALNSVQLIDTVKRDAILANAKHQLTF